MGRYADTKRLVDEEEDSGEESDYEESKCNWKHFACCCCCCCCFIVIYLVIGIVAGSFFVKSPTGWGWAEGVTVCTEYWCGPGDGPFLTPANVTRYLRWQGDFDPLGYKTNAMLESQSCYPAQMAYDLEAYNKNAPWHLASFPSRPDPQGVAKTVTLSGWALKTPDRRPGIQPPRIVALHGVGSNQNNRFITFVVFLLRSMGFDVVQPSLRGHGLSESDGIDHTTWGYIYPYDLLGAWDYAVKDPDNIFGGPIDPSKVGIIGVSMGAMITSTAFALDQRVGAAFVDSGPSSPYTELGEQLPSFISFLKPVLLPVVWWGAKTWSGVDLGRYVPTTAIPCESSPTVRPVAVVASSADNFVPLTESQETVKLFASATNCYDVKNVWFPNDKCGGSNHVQEMYLTPDKYRATLCKFFTDAFKLPCTYCKLQDPSKTWYVYKTPAQQQELMDDLCPAQIKNI